MKNAFCGAIFTTFCLCLAHNGRCSLLAEGLLLTRKRDLCHGSKMAILSMLRD